MIFSKLIRYEYKRRFVCLLIVFGIVLGCKSRGAKQFTIVATTSILGDTIRHIVQQHAKVITLMGPGVDPHAYKATQKDVQRLLCASIVCYNGLHLEGKMVDILQKLGKKKPVYDAGSALPKCDVIVDPHFSVGVDPHIWFDVRLWKKVVGYLSEKIQALDPDNARCYQKNTQKYLEELEVLHREIGEKMAQIPPKQRVLITAHDAFGYFGRAYQVEVRGLQGISTVSECGLKDVTDLVKFIIARNIKALFLETSVPERPLKAVIEGCSLRGHPIKIGGYLYSDALGNQGASEGTYTGMMRANLKTVFNALKP